MNLEIKQYLRRISIILICVALAVILFSWPAYLIGLSYSLGSALSFANFYLMALGVQGFFGQYSMAKKFGNFAFRFGALLVVSIALVALLKLHIISFGCGLVSVQVAIYLQMFGEIIQQKIQRGRSRHEQ